MWWIIVLSIVSVISYLMVGVFVGFLVAFASSERGESIDGGSFILIMLFWPPCVAFIAFVFLLGFIRSL